MQVAKVCAELKGMPELANGYNGVGFSQGGQFLRVGATDRCCLAAEVHTMDLCLARHGATPRSSFAPTFLVVDCTAWSIV